MVISWGRGETLFLINKYTVLAKIVNQVPSVLGSLRSHFTIKGQNERRSVGITLQ